MIFLRAIPFSFSILWRYLIALPALILSLVAFAFVAVIVTAIAMLLSPFVAILTAVAFGVGVSVMPLMVGLRVGLQAHHIRPRVSYVGMMKPAIGYGMFEAVVMLLLLCGCIGVFIALTPLSGAELLAMDATDQSALLAALTAVNPALTWGLIGLLGLLTLSLRAALLVPFAGAAIGKDPTGRPHTPFYGFGSGFVSVFVLVLLSQIGLTFAFPLVVFGLAAAGLAQGALAELAQIATFQELGDFATLGTDALILIAATVFVMLFFFSLQCAGAVLVYIRERKRVGAQQDAFDDAMRQEAERPRATQMENTDLLALVRSRMPEKKY